MVHMIRISNLLVLILVGWSISCYVLSNLEHKVMPTHDSLALSPGCPWIGLPDFLTTCNQLAGYFGIV